MFTRITTAILTVAILFGSFAAFATTDASACEACQQYYEQMIRERENRLIGTYFGQITKPDGTTRTISVGLHRNDDGEMTATISLLPEGDDDAPTVTIEATGLRIDATRISFLVNDTPVQLNWNNVKTGDDREAVVIWGAHNNTNTDADAAFNGIWRVTPITPCGTSIED